MQKVISLKAHKPLMGYTFTFDSYGVQAKDTVLDGYYYDKDSGARKELPRDQFIKMVTIYTTLAVMDELGK